MFGRGNMVKSRLISISQPFALPPARLYTAVLLLLVYVMPSIQVYEPQAVITSVPEPDGIIVKSNTYSESHPLDVAPGTVKLSFKIELV